MTSVYSEKVNVSRQVGSVDGSHKQRTVAREACEYKSSLTTYVMSWVGAYMKTDGCHDDVMSIHSPLVAGCGIVLFSVVLKTVSVVAGGNS